MRVATNGRAVAKRKKFRSIPSGNRSGLGATTLAQVFLEWGILMSNTASKLLVLLAVPLSLFAGSAVAHAEMITFANNAGQSGGTFTIGNTVQISGVVSRPSR